MDSKVILLFCAILTSLVATSSGSLTEDKDYDENGNAIIRNPSGGPNAWSQNPNNFDSNQNIVAGNPNSGNINQSISNINKGPGAKHHHKNPNHNQNIVIINENFGPNGPPPNGTYPIQPININQNIMNVNDDENTGNSNPNPPPQPQNQNSGAGSPQNNVPENPAVIATTPSTPSTTTLATTTDNSVSSISALAHVHRAGRGFRRPVVVHADQTTASPTQTSTTNQPLSSSSMLGLPPNDDLISTTPKPSKENKKPPKPSKAPKPPKAAKPSKPPKPTNAPKKPPPTPKPDLTPFANCSEEKCREFCGGNKAGKCDKDLKELCMCPARYFVSVDIPENGTTKIANVSNDVEMNCSNACNSKNSYARVLTHINGTKYCICLTEQMTPTGITLCDPLASHQVCQDICQSDSAFCSFNGLCMCATNWDPFFNQTVPNVRREMHSDLMECSSRCVVYHHDYVERIYDPSISLEDAQNIALAKFQNKYCLCGPEIVEDSYNETKALMAEGFQVCSGLKCKQRCGMREAICEPKYKRACLCHRQNIFIGHHLWSRLPSAYEQECKKVCEANGLRPRVIEKNPLLDPAGEKFKPWYRKSTYAYHIAGKYCHCITVELDMNAFRPCTDEVCQWLCSHSEAICDVETRRDCICNTHKMIGGLGRRPEPGEAACDNSCRHLLFDAKVIDLAWDAKNSDGWGVTKSKYCACVRAVTMAGLTHCEGGKDDLCPQMCNNPEAFCTRQKYCECGIQPKNLLLDGAIREPNGEEFEECGELCRSWMWPIAEDEDHTPYIYDEERLNCSATTICPKADTTPWNPKKPSRKYAAFTDISFSKSDEHLRKYRRYCLCGKSASVHHSPGTRVLLNMTPEKAPHEMECIGNNHNCTVIDGVIHVQDLKK